MERVGWACLEVAQCLVKASSVLIRRVDEEGADTNDVGCGIHALECIQEEGATEALTMLGDVDAQSGEDDD